MKPNLLPKLPAAAFCLLAAGVSFAQPSGKPGLGISSLPESRTAPPVKPVSREQIVQRLKNDLPPSGTPQDSTRVSWDAIHGMDILSYNGEATLVPKGSIVHIPQRLRQHVGTPEGKVVPWLDFVSRYPAFVDRLDITLDQASGATPIDPRVLEALLKSERITVAVFNGAPISLPRNTGSSATR